MLTLWGKNRRGHCDGLARRDFMHVGFLGLAGLSLSGALKARAAATPTNAAAAKSVILFWLDGGLSHFESYDPKPDAPVEFRGPFETMETSVPGIRICDQLPRHARLMNKIALLRSVHHGCGEHWSGPHAMLTGTCGPTFQNPTQTHPSAGSVVARARGANRPGIPPYVAVPFAFHSFQQMAPGYHSGSFLGAKYDPFSIIKARQTYLLTGNELQAHELSPPDDVSMPRMQARRDILQSLDGIRRNLDNRGVMDSMDTFMSQAYAITTSNASAQAFDLNREEPRMRDRYGRNYLGQSTLLARRLVEAGVTFVTVCHRDWDHHEKIEKLLRADLPRLDQAISSLIDDLDERGLLEQVIILVMGDFGRTPKINENGGRDHWPNSGSVLIAGGGLHLGQAIGATNSNGEFPVQRPLAPADIWATVYRALGIDETAQYPDQAGRPVPITSGEVIRELI